ncbi:MAG: hypothetical protein AAB385_02095 [Planctomycetota bacterium]|jgi:hypothetical protein
MTESLSPQPRSHRFVDRLVVFFVILTCLRIWLGPFPLLERAEAQIPDAGLQRKQLVEQAQRTNELLSDIKRILETQTLHVRLQGADNQER